jgi:glyoxylase-like metal-dependent hydrolase (beta-lactamase superfamily II)
VDPYISANQKRLIDINSLQVDYILLTHAHGDHILDVEQLQRTDAIIVSMLKLQVIMAQRLSIASMNHGWNLILEN